MDAKHRHELEQNDFQEFLSNFGDWWARWGTKVLIALLIVVAVFSITRFLRQRSAAAHEEAWRELAIAADAPSLRGVAQQFERSNPTVASLAKLRAADLLLARAIAGPAEPQPFSPTAAPPEEPDPQETPEQQLEDAATLYGSVVDTAEAPRLVKLNAMLGLASVAETRQQWSEAARLYNEVAEQAGEEYATLRTLSHRRLAMLDRLATPIRYGPEPAPATQPFLPPPATQPAATQPAVPTTTPPAAVESPAADGPPQELEAQPLER